jgi:hypothetical protein
MNLLKESFPDIKFGGLAIVNHWCRNNTDNFINIIDAFLPEHYSSDSHIQNITNILKKKNLLVSNNPDASRTRDHVLGHKQLVLILNKFDTPVTVNITFGNSHMLVNLIVTNIVLDYPSHIHNNQIVMNNLQCKKITFTSDPKLLLTNGKSPRERFTYINLIKYTLILQYQGWRLEDPTQLGFNSLKSNVKPVECVICNEVNNFMSLILHCNHQFHINCLEDHVCQDGGFNCPLCRAEINYQ